MNPEASPFCPGHLAPAELFTGRQNEAGHLCGMVRASNRGKLKTGFITGERGIGKSSLVSNVRRQAETQHKALAAHVYLGDVKDLPGLMRETFKELVRQNADKQWYAPLQKLFHEHIEEISLFGTIKLNLPQEKLPKTHYEFADALRKLLVSMKGKRKSLLLILDDINGLAESSDFAHWIKSFVDGMTTSSEKTIPLCLLLVGLEERRRSLIKNNESVSRIFEVIHIAPWSDDEVLQFYEKTFSFENVPRTVLEKLMPFTGGLPTLAHELGDAVWHVAENKRIKTEEIIKGVVSAADVIGRKYLKPGILDAIRSERYRSILRKIATAATTGHLKFRKSEIQRKLIAGEKKVLTNFLQRMKKLGALETDPEARGSYQFPNHLHKLYFQLEAQRAKKTR